jgi:four helix bundle protein
VRGIYRRTFEKGSLIQTSKYRDSFDHWRLEVYRVAVGFFADAYQFARAFKREDAFLRVQFLRAALSIVLNIAEGCGEYSRREKVRFYRMARRSAQECSAVLNAIEKALQLDPVALEPYHRTLSRIMAMLLQLIRSVERSARPAGNTARSRTNRSPGRER